MSKLFEKTVCLSVTFHMAGDSRIGDINEIETDANRGRLNLSKKIFRSENYKAMQQIQWKTKEWIQKRALPSPLRHGTFLLPKSMVDEVIQKLDEQTEAYNKIADAFIAEYPTLISESKKQLKSQFNEANYPSAKEMRSRFWVSRMFVKFGNVSGVDQSKEIQSAIDDIQSTLRMGMLELVDKLQVMLGERKDGRKAAVRKGTLDAFNEWLEMLPKKNILEDTELEELANKARLLLKGNKQSDLRDIDSVRSKVKKEMGAISDKLKSMIVACPRRSFDFEE
jgi:hypothetical protein